MSTERNNRIVYVVYEKDPESYTSVVIGVADSPENAERIVEEYYGRDLLSQSHEPVEEGNIVWIKTVQLREYHPEEVMELSYKAYIVAEWFEINKTF